MTGHKSSSEEEDEEEDHTHDDEKEGHYRYLVALVCHIPLDRWADVGVAGPPPRPSAAGGAGHASPRGTAGEAAAVGGAVAADTAASANAKVRGDGGAARTPRGEGAGGGVGAGSAGEQRTEEAGGTDWRAQLVAELEEGPGSAKAFQRKLTASKSTKKLASVPEDSAVGSPAEQVLLVSATPMEDGPYVELHSAFRGFMEDGLEPLQVAPHNAQTKLALRHGFEGSRLRLRSFRDAEVNLGTKMDPARVPPTRIENLSARRDPEQAATRGVR